MHKKNANFVDNLLGEKFIKIIAKNYRTNQTTDQDFTLGNVNNLEGHEQQRG